MDKILEKYGLSYEDLDTPGHSGEKEYLMKMEADLKSNRVSVESTREYIASMREAVEKELVNEPTFIRIFLFKVENPKLIKLQARLQNYLLLEIFLSTPERIKKVMESNIAGVVGRK